MRKRRGLTQHRIAQAFELASAHFFEQGAIGAGCGGFVEIDGNLVALPDFRAGLAGQQRALLERDVADGHKGNDVGRADAGMHTLLSGEVNELRCAARPANGGFDDRCRRTGDGDDGTVVIGVKRPVQQVGPLDLHGGDDRLDHLGLSAFGEVGHAFDEGIWHVLRPDWQCGAEQNLVQRLLHFAFTFC
jgi:hypothetical protein